MPVDSTHKFYDQFFPFWKRLRDAIEGEDTIKERGVEYLPLPTGIGKGATSQEYINYKARARYPETVSPAVEGMVGLMSRKLNAPELPDALSYLEEEATPDGLPLQDLINRLRHEVCTVGRYVLFVDVDAYGGDPYIATYPTEAVINWRSEGDRLVLIVFAETVDMPDPEDPFTTKEIEQWRVASVEAEVDDDGNPTGTERYVVRVWRKDEDAQEDNRFYVYDEAYPVRQGETFNYVPAIIIGSRDITPAPDAIPLLGVANKSLHYYRQYADYAMQLYMSANGTTPYQFGGDKAPSVIGPTTVWHSEDPQTKAGYIEVTGAGLEAQKAELENIKEEIAYATVRVLGDKKAAEAAETLRLRFQSQTATLTSIAMATAAGLTQALRYCAEWIGANPDEVVVPAEAEFISEEADAQLITSLYDGIERGLIPDDLLINYTQRVELHDMDPDDYRKWAAGLVAEGGGEE